MDQAQAEGLLRLWAADGHKHQAKLGLPKQLYACQYLSPDFLSLVCHCPPGSAQLVQLQDLLSNVKTVVEEFQSQFPTDFSWAEDPSVQARSVAEAIAHGWHETGDPVAAGERDSASSASAAGQTARQHFVRSVALRADWISRAARNGKRNLDFEHCWNDGWFPPTEPPTRCDLPLVLVDDDDHRPIHGFLTLYRVRHNDAVGTIAPVPRCALLFRLGNAWDDGLEQVNALIHSLTENDHRGKIKDIALAWDVNLLCADKALGILEGPSATVTFALGALWLLREHLTRQWREVLGRIERDDLFSAACSAAFANFKRNSPDPTNGPELAGVDAVITKRQEWLDYNAWLTRNRKRPLSVLRVSRNKREPRTAPPGNPVEIKEFQYLYDLIADVADEATRLTEPEKKVHGLLLSMRPDQPFNRPDEYRANANAWDALLAEAENQALRDTLRPWLLRCWMQQAHRNGGRLQERYVPLRLSPLLSGNRARPEELHQVLGARDLAMTFHAYLLVGGSGSGKSTQLLYWLQYKAHELLKALADGEVTLAKPMELPVHIRLADCKIRLNEDVHTLPEKQAIWQALLDHLTSNGAPAAMIHLISSAHNSDWHERGIRPRLLLDGLEEVVAANGEVQARLQVHVLEAAWEGLRGQFNVPSKNRRPQNALPMLVTARAPVPGAQYLALEVQPWNAQDFELCAERYLGRARAKECLERLPSGNDRFGRYSQPLHFALQCELWDEFPNLAVMNDEQLFVAAVWKRLYRELYPPPGKRQDNCWNEDFPDASSSRFIQGASGNNEAVLLTANDQRIVRDIHTQFACGPDTIPALNLDGILIRTLDKLASTLSTQGDNSDMGPEPGPAIFAEMSSDQNSALSSIFSQYSEGLRERLLAAWSRLGITQHSVDYISRKINGLKFRHVHWREFFAGREEQDPSLREIGKNLSSQVLLKRQVTQIDHLLRAEDSAKRDRVLLHRRADLVAQQRERHIEHLRLMGESSGLQVLIEDESTFNIGTPEQNLNNLWVYFAGEYQSGKTTALILWFTWLSNSGNFNLELVRRGSSKGLLKDADVYSMTAGEHSLDPARTLWPACIRLPAGAVQGLQRSVTFVDSPGEHWRDGSKISEPYQEPLLSHDHAAVVFCVSYEPGSTVDPTKMRDQIIGLIRQARIMHDHRRSSRFKIEPLIEVWLITKFDLAASDIEKQSVELIAQEIARERADVGAQVIIMNVGAFYRRDYPQGIVVNLPPSKRRLTEQNNAKPLVALTAALTRNRE